MRLTLDSNILVYAIDDSDRTKRDIAIGIFERAVRHDLIITAQALGEFLAVIRRKFPALFPSAIDQVERIASLFSPIATSADHLVAGARMSQHHRFQIWDAVIWQVAASRGAQWFVSEDLQDGFTLHGMTAINPFNPANHAQLDTLLATVTPSP